MYNTKGKKLPLPLIVELNRRLVKGYTHFKDNQRIVKLRKSVADYNEQLRLLGIRDHQAEYAKFSFVTVIATLIYRLLKLALLTLGTLPGLLLFAPVFVATKIISQKKSKQALAASTVKLQGRDVMATWKLLVALALAPALYGFYLVVFMSWAYHNRIQGYVPEWVPYWLMVVIGMGLFPSITFAALRIGEIGMDILKSLRPLVLSLNPSSANTLVKLRERREELSAEVTEAINTLGPELFPDFDAERVVADPFRPGIHPTSLPPSSSSLATKKITSDHVVGSKGDVSSKEPLPRNESFQNLANIGFFSTRPSSPTHRSRSSSSGGARPGSSGLQFTQATDGPEQVSARIRDAMRERGERRRRRSEDGSSWDMTSTSSSRPATPSDEGHHKTA